VGASLGSAKKMSASVSQMHAIDQALIAYRAAHASYPPTLKSLVPNYLPSESSLHAPIDANSNPNHVSFTYTRPSADAPMSALVLSIAASYVIPGTQNKVNLATSMSLDGTTHQSPFTSTQQ
jgi:type II secretory pathway pseudopilin PulG